MGRLNNVKSRCFRIELYEDTESYDFLDVRQYIESHYDYIAIRHDKDTFDEDTKEHKKGDKKKTHWHYVIRWEKAPRTASGVSKELGVEERFIIPVYGGDNTRTGLKASLLYLTHVDELEKYQYDFLRLSGRGNLIRAKWENYITCGVFTPRNFVFLVMKNYFR